MVAVINQLAATKASIEVRFWCDRGYRRQSGELLMNQATVDVKVSNILAGKLRRYHGSSLFQKLLDIPTIILNIFDVFLVALGFLQSLIKLIIWRPKVIFLKGGFVCLPVGYAAFLLRIPMVIHDSDAHAGLTNRLLAPLARYIATGAPLEYYNYPKNKASYVGIPVQSNARLYSESEKRKLKKKFDVDPKRPLLVVTGGGLGAKRINDVMVEISPRLIDRASVVHLSGSSQYNELLDRIPSSSDYKLISFLSEGFTELIGAADIVVSRAGASSLAELASVGASVILVPNVQLVGNHQMKNAQIYLENEAVMFADENEFVEHPNKLLSQIVSLLDDNEKRQKLGKVLLGFAKPNAAKDVADLIRKAAGV